VLVSAGQTREPTRHRGARAPKPLVVGIIPARYAATRLDGKALLDIAGKPMIQHVYERARLATTLDDVLVATDDQRIVAAVEAFGGRAVMTSPTHRSGTDRVAEVARSLSCDVVVNIQGDEPLVDPEAIDAAVRPLLTDADIRMSTLATPVGDRQEYEDPAAVQVVVDKQGFALYFSRAPIPYLRVDGGESPFGAEVRHPGSGLRPRRHVGLYVYRRETLLWLAGLPPSPLEMTEGLEQLRALENGCRIMVVECDYSPIGVDTPADLAHIRQLVEARAAEARA